MDNGASSYRRFLDGDDEGIAEIVGDYKDGLILYLNSYVNQIFIAEDLAEDTFFRLITRKPRYSGKSTFKSWLYAIGRNVAVDFLRHNSKMLSTPIEDMEHHLIFPTIRTLTPHTAPWRISRSCWTKPILWEFVW